MLRLPKELEAQRAAFERAFTTPVLAVWPEGEFLTTSGSSPDRDIR